MDNNLPVNDDSQGRLYIYGTRGYSAYEIAVQNGFIGTEEEWLASLKGDTGDTGPQGKSAYQVAVDNGYEGTEEDWVNDFLSPDGYYNKTEIDGQLEDINNDITDINNTIDYMYLYTEYNAQTKQLLMAIVKNEGNGE